MDLDKLIELAEEASKKAWCPYSHFPVGAVIETGDGSVFCGCNVENASSGLTICAERAAVSAAIAAGQKKIRVVVVFTPTETPTAPCGACRQVLSEFSDNATVVCACRGEGRIEKSLAELLPLSFGPGDLS